MAQSEQKKIARGEKGDGFAGELTESLIEALQYKDEIVIFESLKIKSLLFQKFND